MFYRRTGRTHRVVANILPPTLSRTQSFLEVASGVGTSAVTLNPKSPTVSLVLATVAAPGSCGGGGLVADKVRAAPTALSDRSRRSTMEEEVLRAECMDWASEGESN